MFDSAAEEALKPPAGDPPALTFPRHPCSWDFERRAVRFWGRAGKRGVPCRVSVEALQEHFQLIGAGSALACEAFASARPRIEALAVQKWNARALEPDGSILLRAEEF